MSLTASCQRIVAPEPAPEVPWNDVPVPAALHRAHLRRPAVPGGSARPEA